MSSFYCLDDLAGDFELRDGFPELARIVGRLEILQQVGELWRFHHRHGPCESVCLGRMVQLKLPAMAGIHARAPKPCSHFEAFGSPGRSCAGEPGAEIGAALPPARGVCPHIQPATKLHQIVHQWTWWNTWDTEIMLVKKWRTWCTHETFIRHEQLIIIANNRHEVMAPMLLITSVSFVPRLRVLWEERCNLWLLTDSQVTKESYWI